MTADSTGVERPRTLSGVLSHAIGVLLVAAIGNGLVIPVVALPALVLFTLAGTAPATILTALFGVFMAFLLGIRPAMEELYETEQDSATTVRDQLEADGLAAVLDLLKQGVLLLGLYALYLNLLLAATIVLSPMFAPYAVFVPAADRVVLQTVDTSPVVLIVQSVARIIVLLGIVEELDLTFLQDPTPVALG